MSEYFQFETEAGDDPEVMTFVLNQRLTDREAERYPDAQAAETGSTIAQTIFFGVDGIAALTLEPQRIIVRRVPGAPWEALADDLRDVLRDFFL